MAGIEDSTLDIETPLKLKESQEHSQIIEQQIEDQTQFATPEKIKAKKFNQDNQLEYLVAWKEYPGEDTWEPVDHLINVTNMIKDFEESERDKDQIQKIVSHTQGLVRKREIKRNKKAKEYESKGLIMRKVIGLKRSRYDGQLLCKCIYSIEDEDITSDNELLRTCFVDIQSVKAQEPDLLLDFYESSIELREYFKKK